MRAQPAARPLTAMGTRPGELILTGTRLIRVEAGDHVPPPWAMHEMLRGGRAPDEPAQPVLRTGGPVGEDGSRKGDS